MRLVRSDPPTGPWLQLEGDTSAEWQLLEARAALGIRTCGPAEPMIRNRLLALAHELSLSVRMEEDA